MQYITDLIIPMLGVALAWLGFLERRLRTMMQEVDKKLESQEKLNTIVQLNLKEDIARLENKIDMLINLQIRGTDNGNHKK